MSGPAEPVIALVRQRYTAFGGAERFADRALRTLASQGARVTLITRSWQGDTPFEVVKCDPFHVGRLWRDRGFASCVRGHLARRHYDLVQSHERIPGCDIYRAGDGLHCEWLMQRARILGPAARLAQRINPYHRYVLSAERRLFESPRLRAVICNSRIIMDEIRAHYSLPEERLHVIYSGVDTELFHPRLKSRHQDVMRRQWGIGADTPVFLFVGSGFERKGVAVLLEAFSGLPGEGRLFVVGKDRHPARYRRQARRLGVAHRVHFTGPVKDIQPYYGMANVLVLPTLYDPFPNVILEAMASGLPVITSEKCGGADLIEPGVNGFVCDALDHVALTRHMAALASGDRRRTMSQAARDSVEGMTLDRMGHELIALYRQLADNA